MNRVPGWRGWLAVILLGAALLLGRGRSSFAQDAPPPPKEGAPSEEATPLARAKELFRSGVSLMEAGNYERALDYFLQSRTAYPSGRNTANAAICFDRLGRYDEALEMYEDLVARFAADLDDDDRARIGPAMAALRAKLGSLQVSSNVDGLLLVDGKDRGKLPLRAPIRLPPGPHMVRVVRDGYAPFSTKVVIGVGATTALDADLKPLAGAAFLRVEEPGARAADVYVDRVRVGMTPWEGTVGSGKHVVWTEKGDVGSPPRAVDLVAGQLVLIRVRSSRLGELVRVEADPPTAELTLDGVGLGKGAIVLRLSPGPHVAGAIEEGYRSGSIPFRAETAGLVARAIRVTLVVEPGHPRWPRSTGVFELAAFGGPLLGGSLHADADRSCPTRCASEPTAIGMLVGARGGYRLPAGFAIELAGGYATFGEHVARTVTSRYGAKRLEALYAFGDDIRVTGPLLTGGASYRSASALRIGPARVSLLARVAFGVLFARSTDPIVGLVTVGDETSSVAVSSRNDSVSSQALLVIPELGVDAAMGAFRVMLGMGIVLQPLAGGRFNHAEAGLEPDCPVGSDLAKPGCVPNSGVVANERAYGPFVLFAPTVSVAYRF